MLTDAEMRKKTRAVLAKIPEYKKAATAGDKRARILLLKIKNALNSLSDEEYQTIYYRYILGVRNKELSNIMRMTPDVITLRFNSATLQIGHILETTGDI